MQHIMAINVIDDDVRGYLYIMQLREHANSAQDVFKVGRTRDIIQRMADYPSNSALLFCAQVSDMFEGEKRLLAALRIAHTQRTDIGSEYFEAPYGDIVTAVNAVVATLLPQVPRRWPRRVRPVAEIALEPVVKRCAEVVAAWIDKRLHDVVGTFSTPTELANELEAFVEEKGWQCSTISPMNVCNKLVKFHACRTIMTATGSVMIAFPERSNEDALDVNMEEVLDSFICAHCTVQTGLRQPSVEFLKAYNDYAPHAARLHDKALPILMRAKGFVKKHMRFGGRKCMCFDGLQLIP